MTGKKILLEMRPALDGFAGIPQETRLLFRGIKTLKGFDVEGLIQHSGRFLSNGAARRHAPGSKRFSKARQINRFSRSIISLQEKPHQSYLDVVVDYVRTQLRLAWAKSFARVGGALALSHFDPTFFQDFVWRHLFANTLPPSDFKLVTQSHFRILRTPWKLMHRAGLKKTLLPKRYLNIDTKDYDYFISQTPYPARISKTTTFVVRYHDALPILMPHTIGDKSFHQAAHFNALRSNVRDGAYFACVSQATKDDLVSIFPEAEPRAYVIPNMVSHDYYPDHSPETRVPEIVTSRIASPHARTKKTEATHTQHHAIFEAGTEYLLIVSTIEPRKNHQRLIEAWEVLRSQGHPNLKMIVVGSPGWDYAPIIERVTPWIERGQLFHLSKVPSADLRVLYAHARVTVCPSLGEGFDFSGVEAMCSGGVVAASDIAVHHEVYEDVAEYFDPYSTESTIQCLNRMLAPEYANERLRRINAGIEFSQKYHPESVLPKWQSFFAQLENQSERPT